ncbi:peptidase [Litoribacter ruber]|uniref:Peptidase n=1 Tax=Litoribacter ruber TaxID=702568 RepID=A0AAP2CFQ4_9BACT|nr:MULTISPECIES: peptidase [Litoribacter]MBS9522895.1 peptidase [Litoribacter alkaliphilus]MBT0812403.1 peptidase [Litoribacter ruber]
MTFCIGIKLQSGILGLADTRITSGSDTTTSRKVFTLNRENHSFFIMTSGLRSVRDKAITYFLEIIEERDDSFDKLYKAVNEFSTQIRRVAAEDKQSLVDAGLSFNLFSIIGGQLENDKEPKLYLLYPEGNWIEIQEGTPFVIIGNSGFGTPILRRSLHFTDSMEFALKCAFLAFDATRISANDVDYPIDTVYLKNDSYFTIEKRFTQPELRHISDFWNTRIKAAINALPSESLNKAITKDDPQLNIDME